MGHSGGMGDVDIVSRMDRILGRENLEAENVSRRKKEQKRKRDEMR
jgi:hypothetical protein